MNKYLFLLFIFLGCSEKTTSLVEINKLKQKANTLTLSQFPSQLSEDNIEYEKQILIVKNILYKINNYWYNKKNEVALTLVKVEKTPIMALGLPNGNILISTLFLDAIIDEVFNKDEITAIICHESAHILNDDWGNRYSVNSSYLDFNTYYSIHVPNVGSIAFGYLLTKFFINKDVNFKNYVNTSIAQQHLFVAEKDKIKLGEGSLDFNLMTLQGFPLSVEINADTIAMECLDGLGINNNSMSSAINKLLELPISELMNKTQLNIRLDKMK